ncbi:type IX secretion system membrane protein PorP/SprF [Arenibacter sp. TNZ]|jgi:type IX secretion system PorP/SprF family membrane protein|uniref:PorP/SprF family type IX secretion system membrane protein n=1 Tax=Arenibacter TaxID=178469 RepID=UPI000CD48BDE|nr:MULTISPECIES: PorP/SprF family type IX secretion system membrane protein [Arenibacter]MCM4171654.1 type IX secretion system membrane protein PorP/SprF [Arenibacter sp. TNZ]
MNCRVATFKKVYFLIFVCILLCETTIYCQEANSDFSSTTSYHNQLVFNRFLIHPAFSLVRENKSYLNILHRNQYATFADNNQNYFLGYSNKLNDNAAVGLGIYTHLDGVMQEFGLNANYANATQLSKKNKLTFGVNITYINQGIDKNRVIALENDPKILDARKETKLTVQPGLALSLGQIDFGLYAENLLSYNQTTNSIVTEFSEKTIKASLQYTYIVNARGGLFSEARIMPLLQVHSKEEANFSFIGSVLLDLPEYGWLQTTLDNRYGLSLGLGFNLSKKISIGYVFEKKFLDYGASLGWNHEITLAYTFKNNTSYPGNYIANTKNRRNSRSKKPSKPKYDKMEVQTRRYEGQIAKLNAKIKKSETEQRSLPSQNQQASVDVPQKNGSGNQMLRLSSENNDCDCQNSLAYENHLLLKELVKNKTVDDHIINLTVNTGNTGNTGNGGLTEKSDICQNTLANENRLILDGLILRQDSLETANKREIDKRFNMLVHIIKDEIKQNMKPELQKLNNEQYETAVADIQEKTIYRINNPERKEYSKLPIRMEQQSDIAGVKSGYYLIANVYKNKENVDSFIKDLGQQGVSAKQFFNKENGLYYVYLADYNKKNDAEMAYTSDLDGKYQKDKWIMQVYSNTVTAENLYEDADELNNRFE